VNVLPRLAKALPNTELRVLVTSDRLVEVLAPAPNVTLERRAHRGAAQRLAFTYFRLPGLARQWRADLLFCCAECVPPRLPCPSIASFRNPNVFTHLKQGWPVSQQLRLGLLRWLGRLSARVADRVLFVSDDSARWIGDSIALEPARRVVIHHGIDATQWRARSPERHHPRPYFLSVSSIYRYKNFVRLIQAYAKLAATRADVPDLLIIGDDRDPDYARQMREARSAAGSAAERIHLLGEVHYEKIRGYYAGAEAFVFPSYLETFGHPLLEAMAMDVPVVAADIAVFREIGGDGALYADPFAPDALASAMAKVLAPGVRSELVSRGRARVDHFTWERSVEALRSLFAEMLATGAAGQV
jgi:glycosyltransferase involved in cell wall biosynthesis